LPQNDDHDLLFWSIYPSLAVIELWVETIIFTFRYTFHSAIGRVPTVHAITHIRACSSHAFVDQTSYSSNSCFSFYVALHNVWLYCSKCQTLTHARTLALRRPKTLYRVHCQHSVTTSSLPTPSHTFAILLIVVSCCFSSSDLLLAIAFSYSKIFNLPPFHTLLPYVSHS